MLFMIRRTAALPLFLFLGLLLLSGCTAKPEAKYPSGLDRTITGDDIYGEKQSIFGKDGLTLLGGKVGDNKDDDSTGIGVNAYLWRAALDTVSFMPLASADPFGGVIITDWYSSEETPTERFKVNVFILDKQLKSTGIKVKLFRQVQKGGKWLDTATSAGSESQMEDSILTRARQLRVADKTQ